MVLLWLVSLEFLLLMMLICCKISASARFWSASFSLSRIFWMLVLRNCLVVWCDLIMCDFY